jgi:hypothetical protein
MKQRRTNRLAAVGAASILALAGAAAVAPSVSAHGPNNGTLQARLMPLNDSGVHATATADVKGRQVDVRVKAHGVAPNLPHAQHIHFGEEARHECPTFKDDANGDFRLNTVDGIPAYGPIAVSLTTKGDTSPASGLAVDRMPVGTEKGTYSYNRNNVRIHTTETQNARAVARAIDRGEGVVVIHGIDYNQNGQYDFDSAGASELDPTGATPAEATDPAACGVLTRR